MVRIVKGGLPPSADNLLKKYLDKFLETYTFVELSAVSPKGRLKRELLDDDIGLCILDTALYHLCEDVLESTSSLSKVHKYTEDNDLEYFLIGKFGRLDLDIHGDSVVGSPHESEGLVSEIKELKSRVFTLQQINSNLKNRIALLEEEESGIAVFAERISKLESELSEKNAELANLRSIEEDQSLAHSLRKDISALEHTKEKLEQENRELTLELSSLQDNIIKLENSLKGYGSLKTSFTEISNANEALESSNSEFRRINKELTADNSSLRVELSSLRGIREELNNLKSDIESYEDIISSQRSELEKLDDLKIKYTSLLNDKNDLQRKYDSLESSIAEYEATIEDLNSQLEMSNDSLVEFSSLKDNITKKDEEIRSLRENLEGVSRELDTVTGSLKDISDVNNKLVAKNHNLLERVENLVREYDDLKSSYNKAEAEHAREISLKNSDILKLQEDLEERNSSISILDDKIRHLNSQLKKSESASSYETRKLTTELERLKRELRDKTVEARNREEEVRELYQSVFTEIAGRALPRVAMTTKLPVPTGYLSNVFLMVNGSSESNMLMYEFLHRQLEMNSDEEFLFVDLVTESYIDLCFQVRKLTKPLEWLQGLGGIESLYIDTNLANVKVVSAVSTYINDSYYLNVDWVRILTDLNNLGRKVILNIGCPDSLVRNILFNSISDCCKTFVVVKASPINLRSIVVRFSGFTDLRNTEILCLDYNETSDGMLGRIQKNFTTRIMGEEDKLYF